MAIIVFFYYCVNILAVSWPILLRLTINLQFITFDPQIAATFAVDLFSYFLIIRDVFDLVLHELFEYFNMGAAPFVSPY